MQIVVNCETRLCSQFLGPGNHFLQSYGAIFTDHRAATGSGNLVDQVSTHNINFKRTLHACSVVLVHPRSRRPGPIAANYATDLLLQQATLLKVARGINWNLGGILDV